MFLSKLHTSFPDKYHLGSYSRSAWGAFGSGNPLTSYTSNYGGQFEIAMMNSQLCIICFWEHHLFANKLEHRYIVRVPCSFDKDNDWS